MQDKINNGKMCRDENGEPELYEGEDEDLVAFEHEVDGVTGYTMESASKHVSKPRGSKKDAQIKNRKYKKRDKKSR